MPGTITKMLQLLKNYYRNKGGSSDDSELFFFCIFIEESVHVPGLLLCFVKKGILYVVVLLQVYNNNVTIS